MYIHFSGICGLPTEILVHCLGIDTLVVDLGFLVDVEAMGFACDRLKKCRATAVKMSVTHQIVFIERSSRRWDFASRGLLEGGFYSATTAVAPGGPAERHQERRL
jgi:hypothetical protein